ncbi:MAG: SDR family oxidoreductase [Actinobacteria bacterium]|nr:SDR family oxidoreductase [Actinomycetota bacterium]
MSSNTKLSGRRIAITGGARGIGLDTARALRLLGATVFTGDLDAELAVREAEAIGATGLQLDVTDDASFVHFVDQVGHIDVLVNNAGVMPTGPFIDQSQAIVDQMFEVNVYGTMRGVRLVLPDMLARRGGQIVNIASVAGRTVAAGMSNYCATKHAVVGLTRALMREHHGSGVQFTLVMPTFTRTRMTEGATSKRIPVAEPTDVAAGVARAIVRPRDELIVPRSAAALIHVADLLPRRVGDTVSRALGADEMFYPGDASA